MGRLIFITQSYRPEDTILGVTRDWVRALAARFDGVDVIALSATPDPEPGSRTRTFSLGRHSGIGRALQLAEFYRALARTLPGATAVLVHMVPRYAVLAAPLVLLARRPLALWYAQGGVSAPLRLASHLVDHILTPTRDSFPLSGPPIERRLRITGHGIDTQRYAPTPEQTAQPGRLLAAGRLSRSKRYDALLRALALVRPAGWRLRLASGSRYSADPTYEAELHRELERTGLAARVDLLGAVDYTAMPAEYRAAWLFTHTSGTGSLDKVVLEAMACGTPVVSTAPSSHHVLRPVEPALCPADTPESLAAAIDQALAWTPSRRDSLAHALRAVIERDHSLDGWANQVASLLSPGR